jgi:YesN/AraC family two-component response regulator
MNGNIAVQSKENVGTTVTVKLPITQNEKYADITRTENIIYGSFTGITRVENQDDLSQLPVALVVEDNGDVASYIMMCLENKYQIIYAKDGEMGIEMALEQIPDIIISDIMMPGKNGLELCEKLKQDIRSNHIPIILLTAKATQEDKVSGLSHGADAYLTKPFNKNELLVRIEKLIDLRKILQQKYQEATTWGIKPEKTNRDSRDKNDEFINNIIDKISNNIDDSDFQTGQLAKSIHLSESQLYRKIKALTNTSTALFIRKVRLQKAKQLLTSSTLTVSEVAYSTGFNDPSWFSKCFKNEFGYSPSEEL